ncbi:MAG: hypothetical protein Q9190_000596 [Brigantiaea leucoxantha]
MLTSSTIGEKAQRILINGYENEIHSLRQQILRAGSIKDGNPSSSHVTETPEQRSTGYLAALADAQLPDYNALKCDEARNLYVRFLEAINIVEVARKKIVAKAEKFKDACERWQLHARRLESALLSNPYVRRTGHNHKPSSAPETVHEKNTAAATQSSNNFNSKAQADDFNTPNGKACFSSHLDLNGTSAPLIRGFNLPNSALQESQNKCFECSDQNVLDGKIEENTESSNERKPCDHEQTLFRLQDLHQRIRPSAVTLEIKEKGEDSDTPVLISERKVGRMRSARANQSLNEHPNQALIAESATNPMQVKSEHFSSSPICSEGSSSNSKNIVSNESIDLDKIQSTLRTPRKSLGKRKRQQHSQQQSPSIVPDPLSINTHPFQNEILVPESSEGEVSCCSNSAHESESPTRDEAYYKAKGEEYAAMLKEKDMPRRPRHRLAKRRRRDRCQIVKLRVDTSRPDSVNKAQERRCGIHPLQPLDPNRILKTNEARLNKEHPPRKDKSPRHSTLVPCLADDGDCGSNDDDVTITNVKHINAPNIEHTHVSRERPRMTHELHDRLSTLMAERSLDKPPLISTLPKDQTPSSKTPSTALIPRNSINATPTPPPLHNPSFSSKKPKQPPQDTRKTAANSDPSYKTPFGKLSTKSKDPTKLQQPPLRSRPPNQLHLNDFKINPNQNQGYDHPYKEPNRSRHQQQHDQQQQQKCLPGCTNLECCGAQTAQIGESLKTIRPKSTAKITSSSQPENNTTAEEEDEDEEEEEQQLLRDLLGNEQYEQLSRLHDGTVTNEEEKAELLLQAKTKIIANRFARHRRVYAREPSPCGYWETDMPTTQQLEEMRREAEARNRFKVEERWREAMKEDGMWKFRDE